MEDKYQPDVASPHLTPLGQIPSCALRSPWGISASPSHALTLQPTEVLVVSQTYLTCSCLSALHRFFFLPGALFLLPPSSNLYLTSSGSPWLLPPLRGLLGPTATSSGHIAPTECSYYSAYLNPHDWIVSLGTLSFSATGLRGSFASESLTQCLPWPLQAFNCFCYCFFSSSFLSKAEEGAEGIRPGHLNKIT